jgi:hypothetical protein
MGRGKGDRVQVADPVSELRLYENRSPVHILAGRSITEADARPEGPGTRFSARDS